MEIFLLGAGKPAHGKSPTALKHIALDTKVMDWQIHSFETISEPLNIHYLGGYHVDEVIAQYPNLKFTVNPNWRQQNALETFLNAPFSGRASVVSYSDTIFRQETILEMIDVDADVVFAIDSLWKQRYKHRSQNDLLNAETLQNSEGETVEFTGLIYFKPAVIQFLQSQENSNIGNTMLDVITYLKSKKYCVKEYDVTGNWAEFNSPNDIAKFILGTKAETLARLEKRVTKSIIGKQVNFTVKQWQLDENRIIDTIQSCFTNNKLIVRSSSKGEDNWYASNAGGFESLLHIECNNKEQLKKAINSVILSYGNKNINDQVLVQKQLENVRASGVVFTCGLETGSPYYRFNFDDKTDSTESVTAGTDNELRTIIVSRFGTQHMAHVEPEMVKVLNAIVELEHLLGYDKLDIEFAIDTNDKVHIFQVRPITVDHSDYEIDLNLIQSSLQQSQQLFQKQLSPSPFAFGERTLFANMPDWNPAEIIGTSPKPLSFSLYRELITNKIWGIQRAQYGYRNTQPSTLIYSFSGQPYVDVRASINSFIPASINAKTAQRLANAYIEILSDNPQFHDKLEFDVVFTIWTPDFKQVATERFKKYKITSTDINELEQGLKQLTCLALTRLNNDIESISKLPKRREQVLVSQIPLIDKIIALIEDCKEYGTLAFSHAARAGFVATTILKSLVATKKLSDARRLQFLSSFDTVAGLFERAKYAHATQQLSNEELVVQYGHLRPGTYEITTQAYWEDFKCYFNTQNCKQDHSNEDFEFSLSEITAMQDYLDQLGSTIDAEALENYLIQAIQAREYVKFEFTKNLSAALDQCVKFSNSFDISRSDCAFIEYSDLVQLKLNVIDEGQLKELLAHRKQNYVATLTIELPSLIQNENDLYAFERVNSLPNFVTINRVEASVEVLNSQKHGNLSGKIVIIEQADPGYDWLFGHGIAGLITKYGGANSHMAIRAAEINLPSAIGVGDKLYEKISGMKKLEMDCASKTIRELF